MKYTNPIIQNNGGYTLIGYGLWKKALDDINSVNNLLLNTS